jgi:DegV family protein with EDD domain
VDSRNLSSGSGHLAIDAALMAEQGMAAEDIAARLEELVPKLDVSFVLDTLEYLRKGGRCSALAVLGANMLSLKPCIEVKNGAMGVGKKYRGSLEKCFQHYIRDRLSGRDDIDLRRIFITDPACRGISEKNWTRSYFPVSPFSRSYTAGRLYIASHCGRAVWASLFYSIIKNMKTTEAGRYAPVLYCYPTQ